MKSAKANDEYYSVDELLAEEDPPVSKKTSSSLYNPAKANTFGRSSTTTAASKQKDDAYFESLTAEAKSMGVADDVMSDVSDANADDLLREMDMDDLDNTLFKSNKKSSTSSTKPAPAAVPLKQTTSSATGVTGVTGAISNDRPPTRSGVKAIDTVTQKKSSTNNDVLFDGDDILDSIGLDSPPPAARKSSLISGGDSESGRPARSVLDDLLAPKRDGAGSSKEKKPSTNTMEDFMSSLKSSSKGGDQDAADDDLGFGGYMPSTMTSSRPSSKRSVRFDENSDGRRPSSQPSGQPRDSIHDIFSDESAKDWFELNGPSKAKTSTDRPRSEGSVAEKPPAVRRNAQSQPPDSDWLGFNRIGSPDTTPRQKVERDKELDVYLPGAKSSRNHSDDFDFLSVAPSPTKSKFSTDESLKSGNVGRPSQSYDGDSSNWLNQLDEPVSPRKDKRSAVSVNLPGSRKGSIDIAASGSVVEPAGDFSLRRQSFDHEETNKPLGRATEAGRGSRVSSTVRKSLRVSDDALFPETQFLSKSLPWDPSPPTTESFGASQTSEKKVLLPDKVTSPVKITPQASYQMTSYLAQPVTSSAATSAANFNLGDAQKRLNDEMIRQQQEQQAERLQQMQAYQEQMRKIREDQDRLFQQQLQQQPTSSGLTDPYFGKVFEDLHSTVSRLESEKKFIQNKLDTSQTQHDEEIKLLKENHQKQLELCEETYKKREERLKEDNKLMSEGLVEKMKLIEKDKSDWFNVHLSRQSELEKSGRIEIERLKEIHRADVEQLQNDHRVALDRVIKAKELELDAMLHSRDHAKTLEMAIHKIGENAQDLNELRSQVAVQNVSALNDREAAVSVKDESLRVLQDRLERQQHSNEMERSRLQGLITKLELQLTEQSRELEEEKWQVRQQESILKAGQNALEQERIRLNEQIQRERKDLDRSKNKFIEDQQASLAELNRERSLLAEQRAEFSINARLKNEERQRTTTKSLQSDAELEGAMRAVNDERMRLAEWRRELEAAADKLKSDQQTCEKQHRLLTTEKQKLEILAGQVRDKSAEIENLVLTATTAQQDGQRALSKARQIESEHNERLARIQTELQMLHTKQKQIAEDRLSLSKDKSLFEATKNSALCVVCRTPIQDTPHVFPQAAGSLSVPAVQPISTMPVHQVSAHPLQPAASSRSARLSDIYTSIQQDRTIRMWRHEADKDKEFLDEEDYFLEAIKHAPYHVSQRTS